MAYSKVERQTWHDERVRGWTRTRRDVWFYLLTNPHMDRPGGRIGCYVIDPFYAAADLSCADWRPSPADIETELQALHDDNRIVWDRSARLVLLRQFFKHNQPENPNVAKAAAGDVDQLPFSVTVLKGLFSAALELLPETFEKGGPCGRAISEAVEVRLQQALPRNGSNPIETVTPTLPERYSQPLSNPEPEPEPEPEQKEPPCRSPQGDAEGKSRRGSKLPAGWKPNDQHRQLSAELGVDIDREVEQFRDHAAATGRTLKDWDAGFRTWLRKAKTMNGGARRTRQDDDMADYEEWLEELQGELK